MDDNRLTLSVCLRCRDGRETDSTDLAQRGGRHLAHTVAGVFSASSAARYGLHLRGVHCMSQCKRPCTIALSGPQRFTYLFGDLDPRQHVDDVLDVAAAYAQAKDGFLTRPQRPEIMRGGILGRIPPLGFHSDLVEPLSTHLPKAPMETES
ncbi:MAG: DUF1636 domain-containing protein [Pseudomonadota bacterium]